MFAIIQPVPTATQHGSRICIVTDLFHIQAAAAFLSGHERLRTVLFHHLTHFFRKYQAEVDSRVEPKLSECANCSCCHQTRFEDQ